MVSKKEQVETKKKKKKVEAWNRKVLWQRYTKVSKNTGKNKNKKKKAERLLIL